MPSSTYAVNAHETCLTKRCLLMLYNSIIYPNYRMVYLSRAPLQVPDYGLCVSYDKSCTNYNIHNNTHTNILFELLKFMIFILLPLYVY